MNVFGRYASFYDALYRDKNYSLEADHIDGLIKKYRGGAAVSILDLGCGTGEHALALARKDYKVTGVDNSLKMLAAASRKLSAAASGLKVDLVNADIRSLMPGLKYDAVISLFHVISYLVSDGDVKAAFKAANDHLGRGGLFIFDCWYGPAVLNLKPEKRVKTVETDSFSIVRYAEPELVSGRNAVSVNYRLAVKNKITGAVETFEEKHELRYFFPDEIDYMLKNAGFSMLERAEWITGKAVGPDTWGVCFVAEKSSQ